MEKVEKEVGGWCVKQCVTVTRRRGLAELGSMRVIKASFSLWWYWNGDRVWFEMRELCLLKKEVWFEIRELGLIWDERTLFIEEKGLKWKSQREPLKRASKGAPHVNCYDCGTRYVKLFTEMPLKTELWKLKIDKMCFQFP